MTCHALTREAIYSGLLSRERRRQHGVIAAYLAGQAGAGDELLSQLAYHSFEAGLWQQALDCGMAAGDQALRRYATHAALVHLDRAASAAHHLGVALPRRFLETRGRARQMVGDFAAARTDFEAALAEARAAGDRSICRCCCQPKDAAHWLRRLSWHAPAAPRSGWIRSAPCWR